MLKTVTNAQIYTYIIDVPGVCIHEIARNESLIEGMVP